MEDLIGTLFATGTMGLVVLALLALFVKLLDSHKPSAVKVPEWKVVVVIYDKFLDQEGGWEILTDGNKFKLQTFGSEDAARKCEGRARELKFNFENTNNVKEPSAV